ncbi:MAG: class I SAM-dependent methyltransferase [Candidatus Margulisiibacteriota bacterium]
MPKPKGKTSWEPVAKTYSDQVGELGSYYHQNVILPGVLRLLNLDAKSSVLDLGCGQGVLSRVIPDAVTYFGLDASPSLIESAKTLKTSATSTRFFKVQNVAQPFGLTKTNFTHVVMILCLQNMADLGTVMANVRKHLKKDGQCLIVLNHPYFRIPKSTSWEIDDQTDTQFRRVDAYLSPQKIPIDMTPGKTKSTLTWSFHRSLQDYCSVFAKNNLFIETLEEWASDKQSQGRHAQRENRARQEFPLFMAILLRKG